MKKNGHWTWQMATEGDKRQEMNEENKPNMIMCTSDIALYTKMIWEIYSLKSFPTYKTHNNWHLMHACKGDAKRKGHHSNRLQIKMWRKQSSNLYKTINKNKKLASYIFTTSVKRTNCKCWVFLKFCNTNVEALLCVSLPSAALGSPNSVRLANFTVQEPQHVQPNSTKQTNVFLATRWLAFKPKLWVLLQHVWAVSLVTIKNRTPGDFTPPTFLRSFWMRFMTSRATPSSIMDWSGLTSSSTRTWGRWGAGGRGGC